MTHKYSLIACARWENQYIVEWISYHKSIGFDHIYLYCNDDDPSDIYKEVSPFCVGKNPYLTFVHFPFQGHQRYMYLHCLQQYAPESEWVMFLDIDEFLCLPGTDNINVFMSKLPAEWDSIYFNWLPFGNSGFVERPSGSVLLQYTRRGNGIHPFTKSLTRVEKISRAWIERKPAGAFWHNWGNALGHDLKRFNVVGHSMNSYYDDFPRGAQAYLSSSGVQEQIIGTGVINHYMMKSERDFLIRFQRGLQGDFYKQGIWKELYESGGAEKWFQMTNAVEDTYLQTYWKRLLNKAHDSSIIGRPVGQNLALGKPATQSSVSKWSLHPVPAEDAAGAVSGKQTGGYQFHTNIEDAPWWQVDLLTAATIHEIRLFNRLDVARDRAARLRIDASVDAEHWTPIHMKTDDRVFGGVDGYPFCLKLAQPVVGRYMRITLLNRNFLHLDQVEIYGEPLGNTVGMTKPIHEQQSCLVV